MGGTSFNFMIITTKTQLEIGKIYTQNNFPDLPFKNGLEIIPVFAILILREANSDEYINNMIETFKCKKFEIFHHKYYYKISTD